LTRSGLVASFLRTSEANQRLLNAVYSGWLKRPVDAASRAYWLPKLANGLPFEYLAVTILSSQEVRSRVLAGKG
jgi:hypothetical protein